MLVTDGFVGRQIYAIGDLFLGYDSWVLAKESRNLTTFHVPGGGAKRLTSVLQGFTNAQQVFQQSTMHTLGEDCPDFADIFIDDCRVKGSRSDYSEEVIKGSKDMRRFVYKFATTLNGVLK